jgi:hypothetical protein
MTTTTTTIAVLLSGLIGVWAPPAAAQSAVDTGEMDIKAAAEQIDIMRLVIARSINRRFAELVRERMPQVGEAEPDEPIGGGESSTYETHTLRALAAYNSAVGLLDRQQFTSHTRGFFANGLGVIFTSEVQVPVARIEVDPSTEDTEPDEWNEAMDEARGRSGEYFLQYHGGGEDQEKETFIVDPEFVEAAVTTVLSMLGKHGSRMDQIPGGGEIVVALRLEPESTWLYTAADQTSPEEMTLARLFVGGKTTARHLVIRISKRTLDSARVPLDMRMLRREATITQY